MGNDFNIACFVIQRRNNWFNTVIRNNCFHDVFDFLYGGWGIYLDEGSSNILIENNITYLTHSPGFRQHYGKDNIARNNIIALATQAQVGRLRMEPHLSYTFEHNIVYWSGGPLLHGAWGDGHYVMDYNVYWNAVGKNWLGSAMVTWKSRTSKMSEARRSAWPPRSRSAKW